MTAPTQVPLDTLPIWTAGQLLADWWSDPLGDVEGSQRADPMGAMALAAADMLGVQSKSLIRLATAVDVPGLVDEHERLFVGPGRTPCPPYESMWADDAPPERGIMMGTAAGAVLELYRRAGLTMRPHPGELPDHLVVECEALTWCLEDHREPEVARALVEAHLLRWAPRFCDAVRAEASHPYYQALAELTPGWLRALASQVEARAANP